MEETLISQETAELAKEKGFTFFQYKDFYKPINHCSQSLLQKWLREKHNINIGMTYYSFIEKSYWESRVHYKSLTLTDKTYELALEQALIESLKLIP
jgi:hypothetical protein